MIKIEHLVKSYGAVTPLTDVNCEIHQGEVISVIGPSGCGKSTLLRCINQLDKPTAGDVWLDGELITAPGYDITKARRKMGMVFQSFNLFGHLTVAENIMVAPVEQLGMGRQEAYDQALELLASVGLKDKALSYPNELSGGQKQRVAIVRAIAMHPEIMLLDEPTSALDPHMVQEVEAVIKRLADDGMTMMIVTHDMALARKVSTRIFYMDEGGVYEDGTPEEIFTAPKKRKTQDFIFRNKVLELSIDLSDVDMVDLEKRTTTFYTNNEVPLVMQANISAVAKRLLWDGVANELGTEGIIKLTMRYHAESRETRFEMRFGTEPMELPISDDRMEQKLGAFTTTRRYRFEEGTNLFTCHVLG